MQDIQIAHHLGGTIGGAFTAFAASMRYVCPMIIMKHLETSSHIDVDVIIQSGIIVAMSTVIGGVGGFFIQYWLKRLFPPKG